MQAALQKSGESAALVDGQCPGVLETTSAARYNLWTIQGCFMRLVTKVCGRVDGRLWAISDAKGGVIYMEYSTFNIGFELR